MAFILPVNGIEPYLGKNTFVAPNATIVGDVICGEDCSFWFNAVVKGEILQTGQERRQVAHSLQKS